MPGGPSSCVRNHQINRGKKKILHEDMNNLYGWNMPQHIPSGAFHEIQETKRSEIKLLKSILRNPNYIKCR